MNFEISLALGFSYLTISQNCFRNVSCFLGVGKKREGEKRDKYYFSTIANKHKIERLKFPLLIVRPRKM